MIYNAKITSLTAPQLSDGRGGKTTPSPTTVSIRGFLESPDERQQRELANQKIEASAVMYVPLALAVPIKTRCRVVVVLDGVDGTAGYEVMHRESNVKFGGLSHVEVYLKGY